jgi:hypothetical protein
MAKAKLKPVVGAYRKAAPPEIKVETSGETAPSGVAKEAKKEIEQRPISADTNVLMGIPVGGGSIGWKCVETLIQIDRRLTRLGIRHVLHFIANGNSAAQNRNHFANVALFAHGENRMPFSHLFFLDTDTSFTDAGNTFLAMIQVDKPIVALPYAQKEIDWPTVAKTVKYGVPPDTLANHSTFPVMEREKGSFSVNEPVEVQLAGTGAMLIQTKVLADLATAHPEWAYVPQPKDVDQQILTHSRISDATKGIAFDFFQVTVDPDTREYLSEDYFFCREARKLGLKTFILPWASTFHTGLFDYPLNLAARADERTKALTSS